MHTISWGYLGTGEQELEGSKMLGREISVCLFPGGRNMDLLPVQVNIHSDFTRT